MRRVYFIKPIGQQGPVKIGCSISPTGRLSTLSTWAPYPLELLAQIDGDRGIEQRFHTLFADQWLHREWFHWSAELQSVIDRINAGLFDVSSLPPHSPRRRANKRRWTEQQKVRARFNRCFRKAFKASGFHEPFESVYRVDFCDPDVAARATAYIEAPHIHGVAVEWDWAVAKQREWLAKVAVA